MKKLTAMSLAVICALAASLPGSALAEGSSSISSAPVVKFTGTEDGNTTNGIHIVCLCVNKGFNQFWKLKLKAGDTLTVDFGIAAPNDFRAYLFGVGVNDFNFEGTPPILRRYTGDSTGKGELVYKAPRSGVYPLDFNSRDVEGVSYSFTARVVHRTLAR